MKNIFLPLLALGLSATANAGIIIYDNEADFLAATSISNSYNFDADAIGSFTDMDFGDFSVTENGPALGLSISGDVASPYFDSNHLTFTTACCNVPDTMFINFDFGISAFGFDFSNEDPTSDYTVITIDGQSYNVGSAGSAGFFGFVSTSAVNSVSFVDDAGNGGANTSTKYDNFIFTQVGTTVSVPEPTSIAILGLGMLGLALRRKNT